MTRRRAFTALCMLCTVAFSAIAAQSAAAAGTTAVTCKAVTPAEGTAGFSDSGCKSAVTTNASFQHFGFANGTPTTLSIKGGTTLVRSVQGGVTFGMRSNKLSGVGTMTNSESGGEMIAHGTGTIVYEEVTVTAPAGKGCEVENLAGESGKITTNELKATTAGKGMFVVFEPGSGTIFVPFKVKNCSVAALNKEYKVEGAVKGVPTGTGIAFTHAETTAQGTFTFGGQVTGMEGTADPEGKDAAAGDTSFTPLAATT